jgi:hypothetical protein
MATFNGNNYASANAKPMVLIPNGEVSGEVKLFLEEYTPAVALAAADIILLGPKFPAGARIVGGYVKSAAQGGTITVDIGNLISASGAEAADQDSIADDVSLVSAGVVLLSAENCVKFGEKFSEEVQLQMLVNANGANASAKIQVAILYVLA